MKKWLAVLCFVCFSGAVHAAGTPVRIVPFNYTGDAVSVEFATHTWTVANSTSTALPAGIPRSGISVNNTDGDAALAAICKRSFPTEDPSLEPITIPVGANPVIPCGPLLNLYIISRHTSAVENTVQEVAQ